MRVRAQVQHQKETPFRLNERVPMRYQVMGQERRLLLRPERLPFPALYWWLLRMPEQGPHRGQGLPQPSGGWEFGRTKSKGKSQKPKRRMAEA